MGPGKTIIFGGVATLIAVQAHDLVACELRQPPRSIAQAARKPIRIIPLDRILVERPARAEYATPRSRRFILQ